MASCDAGGGRRASARRALFVLLTLLVGVGPVRGDEPVAPGPAVVLKTGERIRCAEPPVIALGRVVYVSSSGVKHALALDLVDVPATRLAAGGSPASPASVPSGPGAGGSARRAAPDFTARAADGSEVKLSDLRGKVVVVDFWATWCGPCLMEMPRLSALVKSLADRDDFAALGVSLDRKRGDLDAYACRQPVWWPQHFDGKAWAGELVRAYGVRGIPHAVVVDREGRIARAGVRGPDLDAAVRALLAEGAGNPPAP